DEFADLAFYFNTFGGNPVSAAVGSAVLEVCRREDLPARCRETGALLRARLEELRERHTVIGDVRGLGTFLGIELVEDPESLTPAAALARRVPDAMRERGVLIGVSGRYGNVVKVRPPLVFDAEHVDVLVAALDETLTALTAGPAAAQRLG
ncbi:aminotransferase class III-fold pyridoxal phosphate-dependent enzyme, partial [Streptomyces sp. 372A]